MNARYKYQYTSNWNSSVAVKITTVSIMLLMGLLLSISALFVKSIEERVYMHRTWESAHLMTQLEHIVQQEKLNEGS